MMMMTKTIDNDNDKKFITVVTNFCPTLIWRCKVKICGCYRTPPPAPALEPPLGTGEVYHVLYPYVPGQVNARQLIQSFHLDSSAA